MQKQQINLSDHSLDQHPEFTNEDRRHVATGSIIPSASYSDQPYLLKMSDGAWLCCLTTGAGHEGCSGQHVTTMRSEDKGLTWSRPVAVESPEGPEASYAVMFLTDTGRVYIFYNYNADNIRLIQANDPPFANGFCSRVDSLGQFVFKYSDDQGVTWSQDRYPIEVRLFNIDLENVYNGAIRFFWNVGKPIIHMGSMLVPLHKIGVIGEGFIARSEGVFLRSSNILTEQNPEKIRWETLPEGQVGLRTPHGGGPIAEEQSLVPLTDHALYCVYRSVDGHPVCTSSRNGGYQWDEPKYQAYADGRLMKHPRAANFVWKCQNGRYLYWFHNHGGREYEDRNPAWICAGEEYATDNGQAIRWSQPEILLYDDDPYIRMSYPDLLEDDGGFYITETQKSIARIHKIEPWLLQMIWQQFEIKTVARDGLQLDLADPGSAGLPVLNLPEFSRRDYTTKDHHRRELRKGLSFDLWIDSAPCSTGSVLLDTFGDGDRGLRLWINCRSRLELVISDGQTTNSATCEFDPLSNSGMQHIGVIIDNGPKVICFVVNGQFQDGGAERQFGWSRYSPNLKNVNSPLALALPTIGVRHVRFYDRALLVTEMIGNYRAGY